MFFTPLKLALILVIVLIIFGAGKLPKIMGDLGKGVRSFKKGISDDDSEDKKNKPEDK